jgi:hypothetical protein
MEAQFAGRVCPDGALRFEDGEREQTLPLPGVIQAFDLVEHEAAPGLDAAMVLLDQPGEQVRVCTAGRARKQSQKSLMDSASRTDDIHLISERSRIFAADRSNMRSGTSRAQRGS